MSRNRTVLLAALLLLAIGLTACTRREATAVGQDVVGEDVVGDVAAPAAEAFTAQLSIDGDAPIDLDLSRCIVTHQDNLLVAGAGGDGSTVNVHIGTSTQEVRYGSPDGNRSGSVDHLSVDTHSREFRVTGTMRSGTPTGASVSYELTGRCQG